MIDSPSLIRRVARRVRAALRTPSHKDTTQRYQFYNEGFHGDQYLIGVVQALLVDARYFVETGANVGSSLSHAARTNPAVECFSCETDARAYEEALLNTASLSNVYLIRKASPRSLFDLYRDRREIFDGPVVCWLDAHGGKFRWPLRDEIRFLTEKSGKAHVFIDDFRVPDMECFVYDQYRGQVCDLAYVTRAICPSSRYRLYCPSYSDRTSEHHPLTGWCLLELGFDEPFQLPDLLKDKIRLVKDSVQE